MKSITGDYNQLESTQDCSCKSKIIMEKNTNMAIRTELKSGVRLSRAEAAAYLGVATNTLAVWKCNNRYEIPYIKVGRSVQYRISDLDKFLEDQTFCKK